MDLNNSTVDGNISAIVDLLKQAGVLEPADLDDLMIDDPQEVVIFIHGDLGSGERIQTGRIQRSIERTERRRLQFVIFIPGLFHIKMACADAIWRIFISPSFGREDKCSLMAFIALLYPKQTSRISSNKCSFQTLDDCIIRCGTADRLECWRVFLQQSSPSYDTLQKFAERKPTFEEILRISKELALQYSESALKIEDLMIDSDTNARDIQYENTLSRIELFLLYEEFSYSIRCGDVGRIETCLRRWIPIFKGIGKHKYASILLEFMHDVNFVYPPPLRKAVRYNWLCNPRGTPMGFRGVDWLLELNNLLTKVIYGGTGSNYTINRIIKESSLIQLFRDCKTIVEQQFSLAPKSIKHGDPDMTETYKVLSRHARKHSMLIFQPGRSSEHSIPSYYQLGMEKFEAQPYTGTGPGALETEEPQTSYQVFENPVDSLDEAYLDQ